MKQRKFADYYVELGNATQSAIKAGYSKKTARQMGTENLAKPVIKSYIDKRLEAIESHKIADAKEVMEYYTKVLRGETTEEVVVGTQFGVESVEKPPDIKTRLMAGREILKRYPGNDKLRDAQARKAAAEADIAEHQANLVAHPENIQERTELIDDIPSDKDD